MTSHHADRTPRSQADGGALSTPERVAVAVLAIDDVLSMSAGPVGQFRSYLPGGASVPGVRLDDDMLELNVVARYGPNLPELGSAIAAAVAPDLDGQSVRVCVDDIVLPGEAEPDRADSVVELSSTDRTEPGE